MSSRRTFVAQLIASSVSLPSAKAANPTTGLQVVAHEQGDPHGTIDPVVFDPAFVSDLINPISLRKVIPDPLKDFPDSLLDIANTFVGKDRWKDEQEVTTILQLFGCPFRQGNKYVAFCAAGIGYCAALAFAKSAQTPTDIDSLRKVLPVVDYYNYYPSPGVLNMSRVARGKNRWIEARNAKTKPTPRKGWLIVYDWSKSTSAESTSHTGIVIGVSGHNINTLEFNTGNPEHPGGGTISLKTRPYDNTVKGFIKTDTYNDKPI